MTPQPATGPPVVFRIDGRNIRDADDFYREIGVAVNGPGGYFGRNLDALADCLRGGFGTPDNLPFEFDWLHSALSRCHLAEVRRGTRPLFGAILAVFEDAGVTLNLK